MDRNEAEYKKYAETMPWWCLPYAISTLPRLTAMYQAHGMPHLVVIDAKNGSTITTNGVDCLQEDPVGQNFPWRPQRVVDVLPAEYMVVENEENEVFYPLSDLDDKYLLLYFSAKTCSLSQEFTPWLVKAFNILKKQQSDDFEVSQSSLVLVLDILHPVGRPKGEQIECLSPEPSFHLETTSSFCL